MTMTDKVSVICDAAARVFMQYGVKRTGMGEIAQEAGVSRQTLYNLFPSKDAVLVATIKLFMDRSLAEARADLRELTRLEDQLPVVLEHLARRPYAMLHASPHTQDVIDGVGEESRRVIAECTGRFRDLVEELLAPIEDRVGASGLSLSAFADAIVTFAAAAKHEARDQAHLDELLTCLTAMVLRT